MSEEVIIINDEPFYRIPNGTSYDYAPIPKQFKPYFDKLQQENNQLKDRINKAVEYLNEWGKEPDADMYMFIRDYKEFKHLLDLLKGDKE